MRKKITIEYIREQFEKEDYKLLTGVYENSWQKLNYICKCNHKHSIKWNSWQQGHRCPYCANVGKPTINFIRSEFEKNGYILLSREYINAKTKLDYICFKGHRHSTTWHSWKAGYRCPYCARNGKPTIKFIKSEFAKEGYKLLTTKYINAYQKLNYICSKGHIHSIDWTMWQQGNRCPYCVGIISKGEVEVRNFIESLGIKVSPNNRSQIFNPETGNGFELDIFMPDLNKAVEYNGIYWHKEKKNRVNNDLLKQQLCKEKDINLLTIWENKWKTKKNICKNEIKKFLFAIPMKGE